MYVKFLVPIWICKIWATSKIPYISSLATHSLWAKFWSKNGGGDLVRDRQIKKNSHFSKKWPHQILTERRGQGRIRVGGELAWYIWQVNPLVLTKYLNHKHQHPKSEILSFTQQLRVKHLIKNQNSNQDTQQLPKRLTSN